jgi:hypothetical protein
MPDTRRASDVQLTIPAAGPFRALAAEMAAKFAQYSGSNAGAASELRRAVERLAATVGNGAAPDASIVIDMNAGDRLVTIRVSSGSKSDQATCPRFE